MFTSSLIKRWVLVAVLTVVAAAAAYYIQIQVPEIPRGGRLRWGSFTAATRSVWLWAGVGLAGVAVVLPLLEGTRLARAADAAHALVPVEHLEPGQGDRTLRRGWVPWR